MIIEDKLAGSDSGEAVRFYREGIFVHVYLKSLYIALTALGLNLKIVPIRYKKLNNQLYLRAGMPSEALERRLRLSKTEKLAILELK